MTAIIQFGVCGLKKCLAFGLIFLTFALHTFGRLSNSKKATATTTTTLLDLFRLVSQLHGL